MELLNLLKEVTFTDHYEDRKRDRIDSILDVEVDPKALEGFDPKEVKTRLIQKIQEIANLRLKGLEGQNFTQKHTIGYKILIPILVSKGKKYPIKIQTPESQKKPNYAGTYYYVVISKGVLKTIILSSKEDIYDALVNFNKRNKLDTKVEVKPPHTPDLIDINDLMGIKKPEEEKIELDYKPRTDYRKGAKFVHDKFGEGIIVNTSNGTGGKGDANGRLDWVDVDFGKKFLKGGILTSVRRINNIHTLVSNSI